MKKAIFLFLFIIGGSFAMATDFDTNISGAYSFSYFSEKEGSSTSDIISHGIDLKFCSYVNESNIGFYMNSGFYFPDTLTAEIDNVEYKTTRDDYKWTSIISMILGCTYQWDFENIVLYVAAGPHLAQTVLKSDAVSFVGYSFGLGGDLGVRFFFNDLLFLNCGGIISYDFYKNATMDDGDNEASETGSYDYKSIRPYLGIGIRLSESVGRKASSRNEPLDAPEDAE